MQQYKMTHRKAKFALLLCVVLWNSLDVGNALYECDFQVNFCSYTQATDDNMNWSRYKGLTPSVDTGPSVDHTLGTIDGYYAYLETSSGGTGYKARLESPAITTTNKYCVEFYYHMYGATIDTLNLYAKTTSLGNPIWTNSGNLGNRWILAQVPMKVSASTKIVYEAVRGTSFSGDIAIDDVGVVVGECPIRGIDSCDFESTVICGYTQATDDDFNWSRNSGSTPSAGTGPAVDKSFNTANGNYMYAEVNGVIPNGKARLISVNIDPITWGQSLCWTFNYHMYGTDIGTLNVWIVGDLIPMWTRYGNLGNEWYTGQFYTNRAAAFQVAFEAVVTGGERGDIAIDEVGFTAGVCAVDEGSCDFEVDTCVWSNFGGDDFDWIRHSGATSSSSTGPGVDHTTGAADGFYLYIEANSATFFGAQAIIVSPPIELISNYHCMSFWYNMYGVDIGSLKVYTTRDLTNPTLVRELLWGRFGQVSVTQNQWLQGQVPLNTTYIYRIEFEGTRGAGAYGDLALDDIQMLTQPCLLSPPAADPVNFLTFECDFEASICGWTQETDDDFNWLVDRVGTPTNPGGPTDDHSLVGNGHYIFTESSSPQIPGDRARLTSPLMPPSDDGLICFYFWYHMYGKTMGTLGVFLTTGPGQGTEKSVWLNKGDRGNQWLEGFVQIQTLTNWKVTIEGVVGESQFSDMAVDDTNYVLGECPNLGFCHFELDFCEWYQEETFDDFNWKRGKGSETGSVGAPVDKTTNTAEGYFAFADPTGRNDGDAAILYSYNITDINRDYCITYWYLFSGSGALQVLWRHPNQRDLYLLWQEPSSVGSTWMYNTVSLNPPDTAQLVIRAVIGNQPNARIAIDEVNIGLGACATPLDCNFDDGYCGWLQDNNDNFDWTRDSGGTPSSGTGPPIDHTPGSALGFYLYIESSSENEGEIARIYSPPIRPTVGACFEVWYHMYGDGTGTFNVYLFRVASGTQTLLFTESGNQGNVWLQARMDIQSSIDYYIVIEAIEGESFTSDIAIDDTRKYDYPCNNPPVTQPPTQPPVYNPGFLDCNFEGNNLCLWSQVQSGVLDDFDWDLATGQSGTVGTGPPADHTKQSQQGHYVHIDVSSQLQDSVARIISPVIAMDGLNYTDSCLEFWYHMYGPHVDTLNVLITDDPTDFTYDAIWTRSSNQGYYWMYEQIQISNMTDDFYYVFEGYAGASFQGDIALDDIVVVNGTCPGRKVCDFETDQCGYINVPNPAYLYKFQRGSPNDLPQLGIPRDHTYYSGFGHFMYVDPFKDSNVSATGVLVSPRYDIPPGSVFAKISYWSVENVANSFTFIALAYEGTISGVSTEPVEFHQGSSVSATGEQEFWRHRVGNYVLDTGYTGFLLYVYVSVFAPFGADAVAVDDIEVVFTDILGYTNYCTFETDACSWDNAQYGDEFDWFRHSGGTASFGTGPTVDHTLGTPSGWYMFIEGSHQNPGDRARLESSVNLAPTIEYCVQFWYHMYGEDVGSLRLTWETGLRSYTLWSMDEDQGDQWLYAVIPYFPPDDYRLVFEATVGTGINSDIAIDDVYYMATCVYPTPRPKFNCLSVPSEEVAATQVCDWSVDCSNGLDEAMCMPNSFDDDMGRYTVIDYVLYPWINSNVTDGQGPRLDWSGDTTSGAYMLVDTVNPNLAGQPVAVLVSPEIQQVYGSSCQISFWYYMSGDAGRLILAFSASDDPYEQTIVTRIYGDQGSFWQEAIVNLNRIAKPFVLIFEAMPSLGAGEIIAIDEITESATTLCGPPVRQPSCQANEFRCSSGACITTDKLCDFTDDCGDFSDELQCNEADNLRSGFENGLGLYSQVSNGQDDADWLWTSGQAIDNVDKSAPTRDHTRNDLGGQFLLFDQTQPEVTESTKAWLTSPTVTPGLAGGVCVLKLWFYLWGDDAGTLTVYYRDDYAGPITTIFSYGQSRNYDFWQSVETKLPWSGKGQLIFEATGATGPDGSIAIDDISMNGDCTYSAVGIPGSPTTVVPPTGSTPQPECLKEWFICPADPDICVTPGQICNFYNNCPSGEDESACADCEYDNGDFCGAVNVVGWVEVPAGFYPQYPQLDGNQLPTGNYLATFVSYSSLMTPMLGPSGSLCQFEFDYYMTGDPGFLEVYLITSSGAPNLLMRVEGDQGAQWQHPSFFLGKQSRFQIQIVNQRLSSSAQVAIDRLNFLSCDTGSTLPSKDANCTFELGTCGYYQLKDDDFDWTRQAGTTSSTNTGPTSDHTTGAGYYMFIETSSPNLLGWKARLALHPQRPTDDDGLCLIFYYHMFGDTIDTLNVILARGTQEDVIYTRTQSQGNQWRKAQVPVKTASGWQVIFEASRGASFTGDMAIDDVFFFPGECPQTSSCTFESGLCSWSQDGLDDFDWSTGSNGVITQGTGPATDFTTGTNLGVFIYANNQLPRTFGEISRLYSPLVQETLGSSCLTFYYILYGKDVGALSVFYYDIIADQINGPVWEQFGTIDTSWRQARATIVPLHTYQIVVQALIGSSRVGSIAVDDMSLTYGACPREGFCDFEEQLCSWENSVGDDDFDWIQNRGATSSTGTGPSVDHTYGNSLGFYLYIETSSGTTGYKARLNSRYYPASNGEFGCITFWYHMYGATVGTLRIQLKDEDGRLTEIWTESNDHGDQWLQGQANVYNEKSYQIIIEGVRGTSTTGDIAIDDVDVSDEVCVNAPGGDRGLDCTFDDLDICSYSQVKGDEFDWEVGVDAVNGPLYDRTTGSGSYAYINMGQTHNAGDRARIISPLQAPSSGGACLSFWYHMSGINIDRFAVYLRADDSDSIVFTRTGTQGDEWIRGEKTIQMDTAWQVLFEGRYSINDMGHIALDDVILSGSPCTADFECDFETDLCGWTQGTSDNMEWTRYQGTTPSTSTGPTTDHTTGTAEGYYIYLETNVGSSNYKAQLYSPQYSYTDGDCFTMWYHMYGTTINALNVYSYDVLTAEQYTLFSRRVTSINEWRYTTMTVTARHSYQIILEAIRGTSTTGDIAVDDIRLTPGPCPGTPGYCDFESGFCTWLNDRSGDVWDWDRTRGLAGQKYNPGTDHTTNTGYGFYMSFPILPPTVAQGDNAILISEYMSPISNACFKMWYHMTGSGTGTLTVTARGTSSTYIIGTLEGDAGNVWKYLKRSVTQKVEFRIFIEATSNSAKGSGHIAIDDVDMEPVSCSSLTTVQPTQAATTVGPTQPVGIYDCSFEDGFCLWQQDPSNQVDWERTLGTTSSSDTGPLGDHTTGGLLGFFIYVDSSGQTNRFGRIVSPEMTSTSVGKCVRFWYNMYGSDVNTLNMIQRKSALDTVMWTKTGNQGQVWLLGQAHLTGTFQAIFEVVTSSGTRGDIALDDISFWDTECPSPDICDFERGPGACDLTQDGTDEYDWSWTNGAAGNPFDDSRPEKDHSAGTDQGYYFLFNETTPTLLRDNDASFFSKTLSPGELCLQFWYRTSGFQAKLDVYSVLNGNNVPIGTFSKVETSSGRWHLGQVKVNYGIDYRFRFTGVLRLDDLYVAIDDIDFSKLFCSDLGSTNFEDGFGTYANIEDDEFDWIRQAGSSPNQNTGPSSDHTIGTEFGFYAFIDTSAPRNPGDRAWMVTDTNIDIGRPFCMSLWYHMYGPTPGTLTLYQRGNEADYDDWRVIQSWTGDKGDYWNGVIVDISALNPLIQLVFEGMVGEGNQGDIALDDIQLYAGRCVAPTLPPCVFECDAGTLCLSDIGQICDFVADCEDGTDEALCGACDFENGLCGFQELSSGSYRWMNSTGATPTDNTGPEADHTLGTDQGTYMYVDASSGSGFSKALLRSPDMYESAPGCLLTVWVHIQGTDIGELGIYIVRDTIRTLLLLIPDPLGQEWVQIQVGVGRIVGQFQIQFEAVRSFSVLGDIALDDVSFSGCSFPEPGSVCRNDEFRCDSRGCIDVSRICDLTDDCGDNSDEALCAGYTSCTFEYGLCSWQQLVNDELDWYRITSGTPTAWTGPERDHTTGLATGHYLYLESSSPRKPGNRARLGSVNLRASGGNCEIRFFYHMFGENIGSLNVYKRKVINGPLTLLWSRSGNLGDFYERADVVVANSTDYDVFQVILEATVGDGIYGDIAIDDVTFTDSCQLRNETQLPEITTLPPVSVMTTQRPCQKGDFICTSGFCLSINVRCDGTSDCADGSDEQNCGDCDFENSQCGWQAIPSGLYIWQRQLARDAPASIAPGNDHTTLSPAGYYMYVDQTQGTFGLAAVLQSPSLLGNTGTRCQLEYWYHMYGGEAGALVVNLYENLIPVSSKSYVGSQGQQWVKGTLDVGAKAVGQYYVRFESTPGGGLGDPDTVSDIALDDISFVNCGSSADISCDFGPANGKTICGWEQDPTEQMDWILKSEGTPTYYTGPKGDHTTEGSGPEDYGTEAYIFAEVSNFQKGDKARLLSGSLKSTDERGFCFSFWYHMYGSTIGELNVYLKSVDGEELLFHKRGTQEFKWLQGYRTIQRDTSFEIVMEAVRGGGFEGDIGLDDLHYDTIPCPPPVECEFESDFCEWSNVDDDTPGFDWQRGMNGDPTLGTGPPIDHSSESTTAYFAFANVANMPALSEARLASPSFDRAGVHCLNFFYNMYGDDIGTLLVYKQDEGDNFVSPSWEKSGDQGQYWRQSSVEVTPTTGRSFQIYFEAIAGSSQQGNMAIDDVTLLSGLCQPSDFCTFEQNLCNWQNDYVNDDFDWIRDGAGTGSSGTGPQVDHTFNSKRGYYMYIEANGKAVGSKAWFVSDRIAPTAGRCFDFWYHMYGSTVETLNLYQQSVSSITPNLVWSKTGNYGDVWNNAKVPLTETEEFWVYFEGYIGLNATSDIALDDLYLQEVPCSTTPAPPTTTALPPTFPPDSHDCDFEANFCYWNQDNTDNLNWTRYSGSTSSTGTGPSYDHTLGTSAGWYIYLETTSGLANDKARLLSSTLSVDNGTQYCMEFWHHMYGPNIASLNIYTRQGADTLVWTKSGEQGDFWIQGLVNIPLSGLYQIVLEATRGSSYQGDIAVDDIRFYLGRCPPSALCDFEADECGYTGDPTSDFSWTRLKAGDAVTSLRKDHSYGTALGHYMYADFTNQPANAKAAIVSPDISATTGSCLNFYFAPVGDLDSGTLTVIRRAQSGAELEVWSSFVGRLHQWHLAQATVSSAQPGEKFNVVFEADRSNGVAVGGVAIDDVKINTGICPSSAADCDFESQGICGWQQVQEPVDDFDWTVISGSTTSTNTGPSKDHTLNSAQGHYAFIESSSPNLSGEFAQLLSPIFTGYQNRCMEFYYHMYGIDSGDLTVYRRVEDFSWETVFAETDNKGDVWRKGLATLSDGVTVYDLIIEATVGGFSGDIAIDDVRIFDGNCPEEDTSCGHYCGSGETCIEANQVCDFVADCPDLSDEDDCGYSCQFESNLCGWISEYTGAFRWIRGRGELPQDNTGPYIDHTTLSPLGYYMYVAPYSGSITWASLTGPTLHNTATGCEMQFWALISGVNVGFIEVTILDDYNSWSGLMMDVPTGDNVWERQIVRIGRNRGSLQVIFRSTRSFAVQGAIAIDDILFNNCDLPVPGGSCLLSEFTCDNSVCIPNSQVCDYNDDCGDFSEEDEDDCPYYVRCSFEDGMCEYSNIPDDDTDWTLAYGVDTNPLPPFDHTLHRPGGSFVYVGNAPANANTARLAGPIFLGNPSGYCGMRLWFFSDGNSPGTLQFAYRTGTTGPDRVLAEIQGPVGNYWERYEVEFDSAYDFQAMIVAVQKSGSRSGVIAVDDITYTDGCVKSASGLPSDPPDGGTTISPCGSGRWRCGDGGCIDRSQVCDYAADCGDGSDEVYCGQCDFENDMCGYTDKSLGNHVWRRTALLARAAGDGYYLSVDTGTGIFDEPAILESVSLPVTSPKCVLQFWYQYRSSDPQSIFNVVLVNDDDVLDRVVVWYPTSNVFDWTLATVSFGRQTTDFYIHFEGSLYNLDEIIYLDEIALVDCKAESYEPCELQCSNGLCVPETVRCDYSDDCADPEKTDEMTCDDFVERCNFEIDLCNWSQLQDDDMDWAWITGNAGKQGGAPGWDHTTITPEGSYLYLYSLAGDELKTAHLGSVVFMPSQCQMRFWYHMYGPQVNRLSVLTKTSLTADYQVKWTRFESQADGWMRGDVIMDDISKFQVVIEAVAGISSATGDHIAIDDISFTRGCVLDPDNTLPVAVSPTPSDNCQAGFRGCRSDGSCITENKFCDFKFDCEDGTDEAMCPSVCNFDDSLCYWNQDTNDDINWEVHDSDTVVSIRAPDTDHTTNHIYGQYIFVDGNLATYNQHARLISPTYGQTGITCSLSFWYYQYDEEYGTLSVYLSTGSGGQDRLLAQVTREADNTDRWIRQDVILPVCITDFQIIIDAINQQVSPLPGGFAVDDVRFDTCEYEDVSPSCGAGLSQCSSGQCYPTLSRCDFSRDCCYDDRDESECGNYERCNFELDMCSWTNMVGSDEVDWSRRMAGASGGPNTDHTTDSGSGFYAIMGLSGTGTGDRAQLRSLAIDPVIDDCYLRLFVYLGGDTSSLTVYIRTEIGGPLTYVWSSSLYELSTGAWIRSQVKLSSLQLFEVVIEATRGAEVEGIVALDDVSFTADCPASASTLPNPTEETPTTRRQTQRPELTTGNKVTISTPTDNNKAVIIAVSVIGGVLILLIILVGIAVFLQRRQDKKSDPGGLGIGNPVYGDTQLSDFKMSSADNHTLDDEAVEDKDGFTNAGFVSFGGEEEA